MCELIGGDTSRKGRQRFFRAFSRALVPSLRDGAPQGHLSPCRGKRSLRQYTAARLRGSVHPAGILRAERNDIINHFREQGFPALRYPICTYLCLWGKGNAGAVNCKAPKVRPHSENEPQPCRGGVFLKSRHFSASVRGKMCEQTSCDAFGVGRTGGFAFPRPGAYAKRDPTFGVPPCVVHPAGIEPTTFSVGG